MKIKEIKNYDPFIFFLTDKQDLKALFNSPKYKEIYNKQNSLIQKIYHGFEKIQYSGFNFQIGDLEEIEIQHQQIIESIWVVESFLNNFDKIKSSWERIKKRLNMSLQIVPSCSKDRELIQIYKQLLSIRQAIQRKKDFMK